MKRPATSASSDLSALTRHAHPTIHTRMALAGPLLLGARREANSEPETTHWRSTLERLEDAAPPLGAAGTSRSAFRGVAACALLEKLPTGDRLMRTRECCPASLSAEVPLPRRPRTRRNRRRGPSVVCGNSPTQTLGLANPHPIAVSSGKPAPLRSSRLLARIIATSTKIRTAGGSNQRHRRPSTLAGLGTPLVRSSQSPPHLRARLHAAASTQGRSPGARGYGVPSVTIPLCWSIVLFRGRSIRQVSCYTLLGGYRLPWPPPCCLNGPTPFSWFCMCLGKLRCSRDRSWCSPHRLPCLPREAHLGILLCAARPDSVTGSITPYSKFESTRKNIKFSTTSIHCFTRRSELEDSSMPSYPEGNFGGNQLPVWFDGSFAPSLKSDQRFARQHDYSPPAEFPPPSAASSEDHHLSGLSMHALVSACQGRTSAPRDASPGSRLPDRPAETPSRGPRSSRFHCGTARVRRPPRT